jgi:hypothetical protein
MDDSRKRNRLALNYYKQENTFLQKYKLLKAVPWIFLQNKQEIHFTFERMILD